MTRCVRGVRPLRGAASAVLAALALSLSLGLCATGCEDGAGEVGGVEAHLYTMPVACVEGECKQSNGSPAPSEQLTGWTFVSTAASHSAPVGAYVYFEMTRSDGTIGRLQFDTPLQSKRSTPTLIAYEETDTRGTVVFRSTGASGRIDLPRDTFGEDCMCVDGRFELTFVDAGPDGRIGTTDDATRHFSRGHYTPSEEKASCTAGEVLETDEERVEIRVIDRCPEPAPIPPRPEEQDAGLEEPRDPWDPAPTWPEPDPPTTYGDGEGCSTGSSSDADGCETDSASSSGCEGDSVDAGAGCEGDSVDAGGSCSGDTGGGDCQCVVDNRGGVPRRPDARARMAKRAQLPLWIALVFVFEGRRRRRRTAWRG